MNAATASTADPATTFRGLGLVVDIEKLTAARRSIQPESVSDWARRHGFAIKTVHSVLSGRRSCVRGKSNEIAVALGLIAPKVELAPKAERS